MAAPSRNRIPLSAETTAEFLVLVILIWFIAGPVSGSILNMESFISSIFIRGAMGVSSTRDLASQLLQSSERIKTLEARLAKTEIELTQQKQQSKDSNKLRALLGLKQKDPRRTIAAEVVERNSDNWYKQVVIDKGSDEGVRKGSAVITHVGIVGQVTQVSPHAAVVRLLTDPEQKLGVVIDRIKLTGILSGNGSGPAKIDFVPVGTNVDIGDKVITLAASGVFPDGHPVGQVIAVRRDGSGASLQIEVKLSENCYDLSEVLILTPAV